MMLDSEAYHHAYPRFKQCMVVGSNKASNSSKKTGKDSEFQKIDVERD